MLNKNFYEDKNIVLQRNKMIFINGTECTQKELNVSLKDIHVQLKKIGFHKPYKSDTYDSYYSERLEHYGLPYMNYIYYSFFFEHLKIPTFEEFIETYIETYCKEIDKNLYTVKQELNDEHLAFTREQLIGRVFRSYNSFHRELELFFQLCHENEFEVEYNFQEDLNGIDLNVKYKNKRFGIASFVDTNRSQSWKKFKNDFRHNYDEKNMINIEARMKKPNINCISYEGIYLYATWFVKQKIEEIKKKSIELNL